MEILVHLRFRLSFLQLSLHLICTMGIQTLEESDQTSIHKQPFLQDSQPLLRITKERKARWLVYAALISIIISLGITNIVITTQFTNSRNQSALQLKVRAAEPVQKKALAKK